MFPHVHFFVDRQTQTEWVRKNQFVNFWFAVEVIHVHRQMERSHPNLLRLSISHTFNQTCFAFFQLSSQYFTTNGRDGLHMVWGRLPATAMVLSIFQEPQLMLYLDNDAVFPSSKYTPTDIYHQLSFDEYRGLNATGQHLSPALIVNKPMTGWLCHQCMCILS